MTLFGPKYGIQLLKLLFRSYRKGVIFYKISGLLQLFLIDNVKNESKYRLVLALTWRMLDDLDRKLYNIFVRLNSVC